jgi:hypothetical protein
MKVFISWSGPVSKEIAEILRNWIPAVVQAVKPYYSPDDIAKGTRWGSEIAKELDVSKVGIICLTKDNLEAPWIMFEAGALSKNLDKSKVCPLLFGIEPADVQGPLVQFQAARFAKDEMKKLMKMINAELGDAALAGDVFDSVFEMWWTKLEASVTECLKRSKSLAKDGSSRSEKDLLEEILALTRALSQIPSQAPISPKAILELISAYVAVVDTAIKQKCVVHFQDAFASFEKPLAYLAKRSGIAGADKELYVLATRLVEARDKELEDVPF